MRNPNLQGLSPNKMSQIAASNVKVYFIKEKLLELLKHLETILLIKGVWTRFYDRMTKNRAILKYLLFPRKLTPKVIIQLAKIEAPPSIITMSKNNFSIKAILSTKLKRRAALVRMTRERHWSKLARTSVIRNLLPTSHLTILKVWHLPRMNPMILNNNLYQADVYQVCKTSQKDENFVYRIYLI